MKAKRRFNIWLWVLLCVPCLLASCDHDVHDDDDEGGLSVSLTWADEADQGTEVKDVKLWIFNANDGSLVEEKHHGSAQEVASQRFALPVGHYQILATTNLIEPFFIGEATRATLNMNQLMFGLSNPSASPDHAYYGVTDIGIDKSNVNYITKNEMRHILAELTIFIEGVPDNFAMIGKVLNVATGLLPLQKNEDGTFGTASMEMQSSTESMRVMAFASAVIGWLLGLGIALIRKNKVPVLSQIFAVYVSFLRGVPMIILLYISYYALPLCFSSTKEPSSALNIQSFTSFTSVPWSASSAQVSDTDKPPSSSSE